MTSLTLNSSITLVFFSILSFLNPMTAAPGANYLYHFCANTTFSANSLYKSSLNSLLSSLFSSATHNNLEFYNTTSGQNSSNPLYKTTTSFSAAVTSRRKSAEDVWLQQPKMLPTSALEKRFLRFGTTSA